MLLDGLTGLCSLSQYIFMSMLHVTSYVVNVFLVVILLRGYERKCLFNGLGSLTLRKINVEEMICKTLRENFL